LSHNHNRTEATVKQKEGITAMSEEMHTETLTGAGGATLAIVTATTPRLARICKFAPWLLEAAESAAAYLKARNLGEEADAVQSKLEHTIEQATDTEPRP